MAACGGGLGLLCVLLVQAFALTIFMLGFFLTRQEVPHVSTCQDAVLWHVEGTPAAGTRTGNHSASSFAPCWGAPRFNKLVMVVIDALRYDFVQHYDEAEAEGMAGKDRRALYHFNHLPVVQEHLSSSPARSLLYRFEADPPTTTMQRLKGLTTGSLPTFLDLRKNFHSPAIAEDNLIAQFQRKGLRVVCMGDDTWDLLFPGAFTRSFPYPSFNTRDLDTVDNGVAAHLLPELQKGDFDVLIAHFLGVDHVGHTYGPSHPAMASKLQQMDGALRDVIHSLEEDSLLVVMGDHGMTDDGNHGGASTLETEAALFLHSPRSPLVSLLPSGHPWLLDDPSSEPKADIGRRIAQVDLVPTLSLLLGLPIPFANLGAVVPELFTPHLPGASKSETKEGASKSFTSLPGASKSVGKSEGKEGASKSETREEGRLPLQALDSLCHSLHINARQVHRYLHKYASVASLPRQSLAELDAQFHHALATYTLAKNSPKEDEEEGPTNAAEARRLLEEACQGFRAFLRDALSLGRHVWTQYDVALMGWALALLSACLLLLTRWLLLLLLGGPPAKSSARPLSARPLSALGVGVGLCLLGGGLLPGHFLSGNRTLAMPALLLLTLLLPPLCAPLPLPFPSSHFTLAWPSRHWRPLASLVLVVLHSICLFSNSYIEAEHAVFHFLACSALLLNLPAPAPSPEEAPLDDQLRQISREEKEKSVYGACDELLEERGGWWRTVPWGVRWMGPCLLQRLATGVRGHGQDVASYFNLPTSVGPMMGLLALYYTHHRHTDTGKKARRMGLLASVYVGLLAHWLLHVEAVGHGLRLWLARGVLLSPLPALLLLHPPRLPAASNTEAPAAPAPSSPFLLLDAAMLLTGPLMLVLGPCSPLSLLCLLSELSLLSALLPPRAPQRGSGSGAVSVGVSLSFLVRLGFYATGHHNQFNRLHYSAAFVASDDFDFISGGALLVLNTFGTEVLMLTWAAALFATSDYCRGASGGREIGPRAAGVEGVEKEKGRGKAAGVLRTEGAGGPRPFSGIFSGIGGDVALVLVWVSSLRTLLTAVCVTVQRRHLMVWAIFAPKLIFESALHLVHVATAVLLLFVVHMIAPAEGGARKTRTA